MVGFIVYLVLFYAISTIIGYLKSNPVFTYMLNVFLNTFLDTDS